MIRSYLGEPVERVTVAGRSSSSEVTAGYGPITILHELSLAVEPGEIVDVLGANGSGKSTALKTMVGLTQVTRRRASLLDGRDITGWPAHRRAAAGIGYVPQTQNVFAELTVADNLRMGAYLHPRTWRRRRRARLRAVPALAERRDAARAGALTAASGGCCRSGSRSCRRPRCLLLDEPCSDLAPAMVDAGVRGHRPHPRRAARPRAPRRAERRASARRWPSVPRSSCEGAARSTCRPRRSIAPTCIALFLEGNATP